MACQKGCGRMTKRFATHGLRSNVHGIPLFASPRVAFNMSRPRVAERVKLEMKPLAST
jgi:hypothetical protein